MAAWDTPVLQALIDKCINGGSAPCFGVNRADLDVTGAAGTAGAAGAAGAAPGAGGPSTGTAQHPGAHPAHRTPAPASPKPTPRPAPLAELRPTTAGHVHGTPGASPGLVLTSGRPTPPHTARAATLGGIIILIGAVAYAYYTLRIRRPSRRNLERTEQP